MLSPEPEKVRAKLASSGASVTLPDVPTSPGDVVEAAIRAWESVNQRIALGRGAEFQLGHGVFFSRANVAMASMAEALCLAVSCWQRLLPISTKCFSEMHLALQQRFEPTCRKVTIDLSPFLSVRNNAKCLGPLALLTLATFTSFFAGLDAVNDSRQDFRANCNFRVAVVS